MSRRRRPHLPGATFHLTTRVHGREALFTPPVRSALVEILWDQVTYSDIELFAYVIMPNHLHLVLRQGDKPLYRFMQPFLVRAALLVQRWHGREGYVFERRFRDQPCSDPEYIRNAIVYTHLNPVRAGLCETPDDYHWSSHHSWVGADLSPDPTPNPIALSRATQLFASDPNQSLSELSQNYRKFLNWRIAHDQLREANPPVVDSTLIPVRPTVGLGDESWVIHLTERGERTIDRIDLRPAPGKTQATRADLSTIAAAAHGVAGPGLDPDLVRSRWGGPPYVRARHEIILRATAAGYTGVQIAAFLRISPSTVYDVISAARRRRRTP